LLAAAPSGDPWVVTALRDAADEALADGAPAAAARFLERALEEPADESAKGPVLLALGTAMARAGDMSGVERIREAVPLASEPIDRARSVLELARHLVLVDRIGEAVGALETVIPEIDGADPELARRLEAELILTAQLDRSTLSVARERMMSFAGDLDVERKPDRLVQASMAFGGAASGVLDAAAAVDLAEPVLAKEALDDADIELGFVYAALALGYSGHLDRSLAAFDRALAESRDQASVASFALLSTYRCQVAYRRGAMQSAEADGRGAIELLDYGGWSEVTPLPAILAEVLIETEGVAAAIELLSQHDLLGDVPELLHTNLALLIRGRIRRLQNRPREALEDLRLLRKRLEGWSIVNPAYAPWRSEAALAHLALEDRSEALGLASEELELARSFGAAPTLGVATRRSGLVEGGDRGHAMLAEAVEILEASEAELELARALTALGSALRRAGRRVDAREPLRRGLDLALRCGGRRLAERAREELVAAGARPRRDRIAGPEALTASERRVAELAARGMTNREIAQALFVTMRTVEVHLTHCYQKLEIDSRKELPAALGAGTVAEG
jgi:ATP/maltotriose-dependent transcriptional regulator MalT